MLPPRMFVLPADLKCLRCAEGVAAPPFWTDVWQALGGRGGALTKSMSSPVCSRLSDSSLFCFLWIYRGFVVMPMRWRGARSQLVRSLWCGGIVLDTTTVCSVGRAPHRYEL